MSPYIGSRWYRAPEAILQEKDYEYGIDIWALGCSFAELAITSKAFLKNLTKKS
jgi:serine/threonine protein kinase